MKFRLDAQVLDRELDRSLSVGRGDRIGDIAYLSIPGKKPPHLGTTCYERVSTEVVSIAPLTQEPNREAVLCPRRSVGEQMPQVRP